MRHNDMELAVESSVAGFLGVRSERNELDRTIKLSQKGAYQAHC